MIRLDKVKIISSIDNIKEIDEEKFSIIVKNGIITEYKYTQLSPYSLYIEKDLEEGELVLEFTGKILRDRYPELISKENIRECLNNINDLGVCWIDVDAILQDGVVTKADVSMDAECGEIKAITEGICANVKNNRKYIVERKKDNLIIRNNNQTKNLQLRLCIYDKLAEMKQGCNRDFLSSLPNKDEMLQYFRNKVRFEMNLNSKEQIRRRLHIAHTSIRNVLDAEVAPIKPFLDEILVEQPTPRAIKSMRDYDRWQTLQANDYDLKKLETIVRKYKADGTRISQAMKPYTDMCYYLKNDGSESIREQLDNLLCEDIYIHRVYQFKNRTL